MPLVLEAEFRILNLGLVVPSCAVYQVVYTRTLLSVMLSPAC